MILRSPLLAPCCLLAAATFAAPRPAGAGEPTGSATFGYYNSYYFRGSYVAGTRGTWENKPTLQTTLTLGWSDPALSVTVWNATPLVARADLEPVRDEVDVTVNYNQKVGDALVLSLGGTSYLTPDSDPFFHTEEVYLAAAWDFGWAGFSWSAGAYVDVNELRGVYATTGPVWTREVLPGFAITARGVLSAIHYANEAVPSGLVETGGALTLQYLLVDGLSIAAGALGNYNVATEKRQAAFNGSVGYAW
jgi:hypothetical protein